MFFSYITIFFGPYPPALAMGLVTQTPSVSQASGRILLFFKKTYLFYKNVYIYLTCMLLDDVCKEGRSRSGPGPDTMSGPLTSWTWTCNSGSRSTVSRLLVSGPVQTRVHKVLDRTLDSLIVVEYKILESVTVC